MSWSTARISSTSTPCLRMIAALASTSPCVWLGSGLFFSVQLTYVALRPVKSQSVMGPTVLTAGRTGAMARCDERITEPVSPVEGTTCASGPGNVSPS